MRHCLMIYIFFLTTELGAQDPVNKKLSEILMGARRDRNVSARVISLERESKGQVIFDLNASQALIPASVTKIMTTVRALEELGADFQFVTPVLTDATWSVGQPELKGSLFIKGLGDPFIRDEELHIFLSDLRALGIEHIHGDVVIDQSLFDVLGWPERESETIHSKNAYDASLSPFALNFNVATVAASGDRVATYPFTLAAPAVSVRRQAPTKGKTEVIRFFQKGKDQPSQILFTKSGSLTDSLKKFYRSTGDPSIYLTSAIESYFSTYGIRLKGRVRTGATPEAAKEIYRYRGQKLRAIVHGVNSYSNNFAADMLFVMSSLTPALMDLDGCVPQCYQSWRPTRIRAQAALMNYLGTKLSEVVLAEEARLIVRDGSGLDTTNRISAKNLCHILESVTGNPQVWPELLASLPMPSWSGSMKDRLKNRKDVASSVRAKTGTLSDPVSVVSLSGVMQHPHKGMLGFAIIQNGFIGAKKQPSIIDLREYLDQFLIALYDTP